MRPPDFSPATPLTRGRQEIFPCPHALVTMRLEKIRLLKIIGKNPVRGMHFASLGQNYP
jgi:hypothetical protein